MPEEDGDGDGAGGSPQRFQLVYEPSPIEPPDGGYGWAVVAAAFLVNLIADGVTFSFGILLSELFSSLDESREDISWIGSFLAGVPLLLGPVTSLLIDRFGCRSVTLAGGLISGVGFALMYVLPKSTLLFVFSAGLLSGLGLGLVFMPAVVAVSFYFLEKRALATGIAMSGSGVGTVVFAYIVEACIAEYTWRGSFLIVGGILLNVCICGSLYRPLEPPDLHRAKRMQRLYIKFEATSFALPPGEASASSDNSSSASLTTSAAAAAAVAASSAYAKSALSIPTYLADELHQHCDRPPTEKQLIASLKLGYLQRLAASPGSLSGDPSATVHGTAANGSAGSAAMAKANTSHELVDYAQRIVRQQKQQQKQQQQQEQEQQQQQRRMSIVVCLPQVAQPQLQQAQPSRHPRVRRQLFPIDRRHFMRHARPIVAANVELWDSCPEFGRIPTQFAVSPGAAAPPATQSLARSILKSKPFRDMRFLFASWDYVAFLASNFLLYFWYDITYTFLPDHAKEIGLSTSDVSLIIGLIGVSNTVGQIAIGYVGDFPRVNSALLYAVCMSLTGVANFLVPWCLSLPSLLVYGIVYGFLVSANYSLCSIVLIDLFGLDRLTTGYGFMMFFQGVANLVGPPAMGHMRDVDANYNRAFVYSGIFVLASNLLILPVYRSLYWLVRGCCRPRPPAAGAADVAVEAADTLREPLASA